MYEKFRYLMMTLIKLPSSKLPRGISFRDSGATRRSLCECAGDGLVKVREVWCAETCCVVPARRRWIVEVIATRNIEVAIPASLLVCRIIQLRCIPKGVQVLHRVFVHQRLTGGPDWRGGACSTHVSPLSLEIDGKMIRDR